MTGIVFDFEEPFFEVKQAVLTNGRFACDYVYHGDRYHVEASSTDGLHFFGHWGCPNLTDHCTVELQRFDSKAKEVILLGPWRNNSDNEQGIFLFRLAS